MMMEKREEKMDVAAVSGVSQFAIDQIGGIFDIAVSSEGDHSYQGFLELLGLQDLPGSFFDPPPPAPPVEATPLVAPPESSLLLNLPATPNSSSISSSSTEAATDANPAKPQPQEDEQDEARKTRSGSIGRKKKRKKGQKRQSEPRFAFRTRSEVDHLEDGYRWRKYGQKAVRNSAFPRSYYRCTSARCGVKKRVERSSQDPTVVVTTYEGQHTHPSPVVPRGVHLAPPPPHSAEKPPPPLAGLGLVLPPLQAAELNFPYFTRSLPPRPLYIPHVPTGSITAACDWRPRNPTAGIPIRDHGLLQDVIPWHIMKKEE